MIKKITAICLTFILVMSMAIIPVFASVNQNGTATDNQANIVRYDKKDKNDKKGYNDDTAKLIADLFKLFSDSDDFSWAEKSIERLGALGIFSGNGKGNFNPKNNVTQAEAIAMVLKLTGYQKEAEAIKVEPNYFKGQSDSWSYGYLQLALDKGIIIPSEDGDINPRTPAKRYEIAKYVVRALGKRDLALQNMNATLNFKDAASIPANARGYVFVIADLKIMQGSDHLFQPNKPITRAEMAVILDKAENKTEDPTRPSTTLQGSFISYDSVNYKLTLNVKNKTVVYNILPNVPVYKNATYFGIDSLKPGDVVKVVVDSQKKIIFIEFVQDASTVPTTGKLSTQTILYENLPQILKDRVDALKYTQSFTAFKYNQSIYLIATRGQMPTGGYTIDIKDVYKETVQTGKYNLKAVVEMTTPTDSYVTQVISYPYEIVKLNYFNGIDKVNFLNTSNTLLAQTTINTLDASEIVNGRIDSVDATNRIVNVLENDGIVRSYLIPSNVQITLNNQPTILSALVRNMPVAITKSNGIITNLAAQSEAQVIETISGSIDSVDATNRILRVLENDNNIRTYLVPTNVVITLNNTSVYLTSLVKDMPIVITKTNGIITRLAATNIALETVSGKVEAVDATNRILSILGNDNVVRTYLIPTNVEITLNNTSVTLASLVRDMPIVITKTNGIITRLAATTIALETISGKVQTVDATNRILIIVGNDNVVRTYLIPTNVEITLNNTSVTLASLVRDMPIVITKTNGIITRLAATTIALETISGRIDTVDATNRILRVVENDNVARTYLIPTNVEITLNNNASALTALVKDMTIVITKTNGIITRLAAQSNLQTIEGILLNTYINQNRTYMSVRVGTATNEYEIVSNTAVIYNNQISTIQNIPFNSPLTIKILNGVVIEVRNN